MKSKREQAEERKRKLEKARLEAGFEEAIFDNRGIIFRQSDLLSCVCGGQAIIEVCIYPEEEEAERTWIVRRPEFDRRTQAAKDYALIRDDWNAKRYTELSERMNLPLLQLDPGGQDALTLALLQLDRKQERRVKKTG